jgi:hypothetical protein
MTLEDFNNIVDSYGLHKMKYNPVSGFFDKASWGLPVVTFQVETGKLKIYIDLNEEGKMSYSERHIIVSEVSTANYFLKRLFKQRKKILVDNKLKEINRDFA